MKKILLIFLISMTGFTQSYDPNRVLKLDTDLINLFTCSGMVSGNSFNNWDSGIFSDDQMKDDTETDIFEEQRPSEQLFDQDINEEEDFEIPAFLRRQKF